MSQLTTRDILLKFHVASQGIQYFRGWCDGAPCWCLSIVTSQIDIPLSPDGANDVASTIYTHVTSHIPDATPDTRHKQTQTHRQAHTLSLISNTYILVHLNNEWKVRSHTRKSYTHNLMYTIISLITFLGNLHDSCERTKSVIMFPHEVWGHYVP